MIEIIVGFLVLWLLSSKEDVKHDGYFYIHDHQHKNHEVSDKHHCDHDDNDWDGDNYEE